MTYPFVASRYRRGERSGPTLGMLYHMAEGGNTVQYLANDPARGVSVHFVVEYSGRIVQMLQWDEIAGTLNPRDRSTDKAYYGHDHLVDVLGDWWTNPNNALIQVEMEGFALTGPNLKQRDAVVALTADAVRRFPTIRGALGHADQTNTKACPGTTPNMKAIFASVGGHGLWQKEDDVPGVAVSITERYDGTAIVSGPGHAYILVRDGAFRPVADGWPGPEGKEVVYRGYLTKPYTTPGGTIIPAETKVIGVGLDEAILLEKDVILTPREPDTSGDVNAAVDYITEAYVDLGLRIEEARAR